MKRFWTSVALCLSLLAVGLFFFQPSTGAQSVNPDPLPALLSMPAPPPPNPFFRPNLTERDEEFYSKRNPPPDDAPIEDLMDYWNRQNNQTGQLVYTPKLSEKALKRILDEIEKKPERLTEYLNLLPDTTEAAQTVKELYDRDQSARKSDPSWRTSVKRWLTYHTPYFSDELYASARQAGDTKEYVTNQDEVIALARVDWEKAKPLLDKMLSDSAQPVSQTLARWAYYKHALAVNDSFDIDKYRRELQDTVENKSALPGNRDLAMDALVSSGDFAGRDEWYFSLLEDETLYELRVGGQVYTGLTTIINHSEPDKYLDKMVELAASSSPAARNAAVRNLSTMLTDKNAPKIVRALLPWLENPRWAKEVAGERQRIVAALRNVAMPESVPGLIAMLNEKERAQVATTTTNSNITVTTNRAYNSNTVVAARTVDYYPFRSAAIAALEKQKSPLAASALRQLLGVVEPYERQAVIRAALASSGFTVTEQVEALERVAKTVPAQEQPEFSEGSANRAISDDAAEEEPPPLDPPTVRTEVLRAPPLDAISNTKSPYDPNDLKYLLGTQMISLEEPSEELVKTVIDRIAFYDRRDAEMAAGLRRIIQNWRGTAINSLFLRDLKDNKANATVILRLLILRKELREKQGGDIAAIRSGSPAALGISACLLEEPGDFDAILSNGADEAKTALFACARLIRAPLSVPKAAALLKSPNKLLALAAERYLESEDSPEARAAVLSVHPNEAKILGARLSFSTGAMIGGYSSYGLARELFMSVDPAFARFPAYYFYGMMVGDEDLEKRLQKEVKTDQELLGVYAYDKNFVRIYKDKVLFSREDDPARYRERALSGEEFEAFKNFLMAQRVDELPPFLSPCESCETKELLMLGRAGGRRVFLRAEPVPQFFTELESIFEEFRRPPAQIHYYLEKQVPGLEVLFADDNLRAETVWKTGDDFRLLIDDAAQRRQNEQASAEMEEKMASENPETADAEEETPENKAAREEAKRRMEQIAREKEYGSYAWYQFDRTKLAAPAAQPDGFWFVPPIDGFAVPATDRQWKARAAGFELRADQTGLYKIKGGQLTKIRDGYYYSPLVTPNGRWAIAAKYSESEEEYGGATVRVNLLTNKEFKIDASSDYGAAEPLAFLPALNKVVLFTGYGEGEGGDVEGEREGDFFLLDADTGVVQPMRGEGRPLLQQTFRQLQPAAVAPDTFWAAIPDREKQATQIGLYNARTLSFKSLLNIPQIVFYSMDMWIDEREGKIYFVYEGQLLALPLPKAR